MEVKPDRMVSLGYGKYWRSDAIVGLLRIDDDRGPGRRTEVYTATVDEPIVASRSERAILQDMAVATEDLLRIEEAREALSELADSLHDIPNVLKRMLVNEANFEPDKWVSLLRSIVGSDFDHSEQSELFEGRAV